jgi:quercetin dioxygenase-like cupin family protein
MALKISERDLTPGKQAVELHSGAMKTLFVYGNEANMMVATRSAGYHSKPHRHTPEQLNYVVSGELWIFIDEEGYHLKTGDFLRIPGNALHWAWNRGTTPCTMVQVHAPVLAPESRAGTYGLFADDEVPRVNRSAPSESLDIDVSIVEKRVFDRSGVDY